MSVQEATLFPAFQNEINAHFIASQILFFKPWEIIMAVKKIATSDEGKENWCLCRKGQAPPLLDVLAPFLTISEETAGRPGSQLKAAFEMISLVIISKTRALVRISLR